MASTGASRRITLEELTVADVDSHVTYSFDDLLPYFDERQAGIRKLIEFADHPASEIYSAFRATPAWFQTRRHDASREYDTAVDGEVDSRIHKHYLEQTTPEQKLAMMDDYGIDYTILGTGPSRLATVNHDPTAVAIASAYNSYVIDTFTDVDERLLATITVAPQKPDAAAEEIDRVGDESGIVGVQLPAIGLIPPAGHPWYDPIYEAAQDHDLAILMHSGNAATWPVFPAQRYWAETFVEDHAFTFVAEPFWHIISMIFRGVPERFPELDFVFQEAGAEWLGWMMGRLDEHYLMSSQDVPMLSKPPSEYIVDQFYFGTQPVGERKNRQHTAMLLELAGGADTVMFSTDHPHPDFDPPKDLFDTLRTHVGEEDLRGIMGETALDVFGIS